MTTDHDDTTESTRLSQVVTRFPVAFFAVVVAALALSMWYMLTASTPVLIDYQVYRWAVATWLDGGDIVKTAPTTSIGMVLPWVYPPFALLPLSVVALVPFGVGVVLLYAVDVVALGATLYLVTRQLWPAADATQALAVAGALLPLTLFLEPVAACFGLGQINIALMGLVVADCLAKRPRWPRGLLIGLAAAIKLTPAAFVLFFLLRRDFRASAVVVATAATATLIGFVVDFSASVDYWFRVGPASGVSGSAYHTNQTIMGALARLDLSPALARGAWVVLCLALLAAVAAVVLRAPAALAVVAIGLFALLVSPTSWSDHWVWLVPALLVMIGYAVRQRSVWWGLPAVATAVIGWAAPFKSLPGGDGQELAWTQGQHLLGNSYVLLGVLLVAVFAVTAASRPALSRAR